MKSSVAIGRLKTVLSHEREFAEANEAVMAEMMNEEPPYYLKRLKSDQYHFENSYNARPSHQFAGDQFFNIGADNMGAQRKHRLSVDELSAALVRDIVLPMANIDPISNEEAHPACFWRGERADACILAEGYFLAALKQIVTGRKTSQDILTVYHSPAGQPILLRKQKDVSTALTLEPLIAGGMPIPPGTIVSVPSKRGRQISGQRNLPRFTVQAYPIDEPLIVRPVRFTPWVYDEAIDRSVFAICKRYDGDLVYRRDRGVQIERYGMDDFRTAAGKVMTICGVA